MKRILVITMAILTAMFVMLMFPLNVSAQGVDSADTTATIRLSPLTVTLVVSLVIPIVTGLLTKATLASFWKGLITLVLNLVNAAVVGAVVADGSAVWSEQTLITALLGMAISVATYAGIYKPAHLTSSDAGLLMPGRGIG